MVIFQHEIWQKKKSSYFISYDPSLLAKFEWYYKISLETMYLELLELKFNIRTSMKNLMTNE